MARKPVNEISALQTRTLLWTTIRTLGTFTLRDLWGETRYAKDSIRDYLIGLEAAGFVERLPGDSTRQAGSWQLVRDNGIEPPRVRRDGTPITQGLGREQMWRTMRQLKGFTALDLSVQASTEEAAVTFSTAQEYCKYLARAGYLAVVQIGHGTGQGGIPTRYRFISTRNTGPQPPMIQRTKQLYDPNLGKVVWSSTPDDAEGLRDKGGRS